MTGLLEDPAVAEYKGNKFLQAARLARLQNLGRRCALCIQW